MYRAESACSARWAPAWVFSSLCSSGSWPWVAQHPGLLRRWVPWPFSCSPFPPASLRNPGTLAGNLAAAVIGVSCARWIPAPWLAAGVALGLVLIVMFLLHCLHPPAGGVAMMAVLGEPAIQELGYRFVVWPVGINVVLLLLAAIAFNAFTQRNYPNRILQGSRHHTHDLPANHRVGATADDLMQTIAERAQLLDVSLADLQEVVQAVEVRAHQRRLGDLRCRDVMSRDVIGVSPDASVADAWRRLAHHRFRALPVITDQGVLQGIVSLRDFLDATEGRPGNDPPCWSAERRVRDIMTSRVHTARPDQPIAELVPLLGGGGLHQVPVVAGDSVVGMLSQSDLVAALFAQGLGRA